MFGQAAQDSGLAGMAVNQVDQMTNGVSNGMKNEDQVQMLYQLMALHPNEVALFFLEYPNFMTELTSLIGLIMRKELYDWFSWHGECIVVSEHISNQYSKIFIIVSRFNTTEITKSPWPKY